MTNDKPEDLDKFSGDTKDIVILSQSESIVDPIEKSLFKQIESAKTPEEAEKYLSLIEKRQRQLIQKKYTDLQLRESENQISYERKLLIFREIATISFSLIAIVVGIVLSLKNSMPLISPVLIILGLIKPLRLPIQDVIKLISSFNGITDSSQKYTEQKSEKD